MLTLLLIEPPAWIVNKFFLKNKINIHTYRSELLTLQNWISNFSFNVIIIIIIINHYFTLLGVFFLHQRLLIVFHRSLNDSKSPQASRTLLSIPADLNNAVICMVFTGPLIFKSSSPFINPLMTVPSAPITIRITVTFIFHSFSVLLQGLCTYLSFRFHSVLPCYQPERQSPLFDRFSFSCWLSLDLVVLPRLVLFVIIPANMNIEINNEHRIDIIPSTSVYNNRNFSTQ